MNAFEFKDSLFPERVVDIQLSDLGTPIYYLVEDKREFDLILEAHGVPNILIPKSTKKDFPFWVGVMVEEDYSGKEFNISYFSIEQMKLLVQASDTYI